MNASPCPLAFVMLAPLLVGLSNENYWLASGLLIGSLGFAQYIHVRARLG